MTPERLAELRARYAVGPNTSAESQARVHIRELADALEGAWAERDHYRHTANVATNNTVELRARAELAEAELVQAGLDGLTAAAEIEHLADRAERAEAALARVRDLCYDPDADPVWAGLVHADEIRAAIEGDQ